MLSSENMNTKKKSHWTKRTEINDDYSKEMHRNNINKISTGKAVG